MTITEIKRSINAELIAYKKEYGLNQRELAAQLEISESVVSKMLKLNLDQFTIDRLIRYCETLGIRFKFKRL